MFGRSGKQGYGGPGSCPQRRPLVLGLVRPHELRLPYASLNKCGNAVPSGALPTEACGARLVPGRPADAEQIRLATNSLRCAAVDSASSRRRRGNQGILPMKALEFLDDSVLRGAHARYLVRPPTAVRGTAECISLRISSGVGEDGWSAR